MMATRALRTLLTLALAAAVLVVAASNAYAVTVTVTTTADTTADDGVCSLREAIESHNTNTASGAMPGECPAGITTIDVPAGHYVLTDGPLVLSGSPALTLSGASAETTIIDGNNASQVITLDGVAATSAIEHVTITGGNSSTPGGGIGAPNGFFFTIRDSIISGNEAGLGGGLGIGGFGFGSVIVVERTTIENNTAILGGGVHISAGSTVTIRESTINNNDASRDGGGLYNDGGGITLENATVSGNDAIEDGGGLYTEPNSTNTSAFTTITANTAPNASGIAAPETTAPGLVTLNTSIVADNVGGNDLDFAGLGTGSGDPFATAGFNVIGTVNPNIVAFNGADDLVGQTNIGLGPLADNGGPTLTHMPGPGTVPVDRGEAAITLATDQRGVARPLETTYDAGAVETDHCTGVTAVDVDDETDWTFAINCYNLLAAGTLAANFTTDTVTLTAAAPVIDNDTAAVFDVNGMMPGPTTLDANSTGRVIDIANGNVTIDDLTITGGSTASDGAGVKIFDGTLAVTDSAITGNTSLSGFGGGLSVRDDAEATVTDSTIAMNSSASSGGGAFNQGILTLTRTTVDDNDVPAGYGGGVDNLASLTIVDSTLSNNDAGSRGGGIANSITGTVNMTNSTVSGNDGAAEGGGIANSNGTLEIIYSTITDNTATAGAGVLSQGGSASIAASLIADNNTGLDLDRAGGTPYTSGSFNVLGTIGAGITAFGAGTDDLTGQIGVGLGALADNGGSTLTHLPSLTSPVVDYVTGAITVGTAPAADQAGRARPVGAADDAGAVEATQCISPVTVGNETDWLFAIACYNMLASGNLDVDFTGDVTLTGAATSIDNATSATLHVNGDGHTIDANSTARVIDIADGNVTIDALTMTGGQPSGIAPGGGLFVDTDAVVTVTDSTITGNSAFGSAGAANLGELTIEDSTISDNTAGIGAGGIGNTGTLTIRRSTLVNIATNTFRGGGIGNAPPLGGCSAIATIEDSSIIDNEGIIGGGIFNSATMTITNSTLSGNFAASEGGGIYTTSSDLTVLFSTVADNQSPVGAGIASSFAAPTVTNVSASIVAANTGGGFDVELVGGTTDTFMSGSFNLLGSVGADIVAFGNATSDLLGEDPLLAPLNNSGPMWFHPLQDGSMAIDRVMGPITIGTAPALDQLGTARPQGAHSDIGAEETTTAVPPLCDGVLVTINMKTGPNTGTGTSGNDVFLGTNGDDTINGLDGNDRICGGAGDDTINGGDGIDRILGQSGEDIIDGGNELDRIWGGADDDEIDGGEGDDVIRGNAGNDVIDGGLGADRIYGNADDDTLRGQDGDDRLFGNEGDDILEGGDNDDDLYGHGGTDTMNGGDDDDLLNGSSDEDDLDGGDGTDTLRGGSEDDTLDGGAGDNDTVVGQGGDDTLSGGAGTGDICRGKSHVNGDVADATCESVTTVP